MTRENAAMERRMPSWRFSQLPCPPCAPIAKPSTTSPIKGANEDNWLCQFLVLRKGISSEETSLRIFRALVDPKQFEAAFGRRVAEVFGASKGSVTFDGTTVRGSGSGGEAAIHMVSAFATELGVVLGQ